MGTNTKTEKEIGPSISLLHSVDGEERERANRSVSGFRRSRRKRYDDLEGGKERERKREGEAKSEIVTRSGKGEICSLIRRN